MPERENAETGSFIPPYLPAKLQYYYFLAQFPIQRQTERQSNNIFKLPGIALRLLFTSRNNSLPPFRYSYANKVGCNNKQCLKVLSANFPRKYTIYTNKIPFVQNIFLIRTSVHH